MSGSGSGTPEIASASRAVPAASSGLRESSVSSPVARIRTVQAARSGSSSGASSRQVPATSTGVSAARPRKNVRNASVSWSHHCTVVQDQRHRPADRHQRPGQAFEEPVALPRVHHGPGARTASRAPRPAAAGRPRPARPGRAPPKPPGPPGAAASPPPAPSAQPAQPRRSTGCWPPPRPARPGQRGHLGRDAGFLPTPAPPRIRTSPGDAGRGLPPEPPEPGQLLRPPDQPGRRDPRAAVARCTGRPSRAVRPAVRDQPLESLPRHRCPGSRRAHVPAPKRSGGTC